MPTAGEMEQAILAAIKALLNFKDDRGEPFNDMAKSFLIMVPIALMDVASAALGSQIIVDASTSRTNNILTVAARAGMTIELAVNSRLASAVEFYTFRTDTSTNALISQDEKGVSIKAQAEGSPLEFTNDVHQYGVDARRGVGFGMWPRAALTTLN